MTLFQKGNECYKIAHSLTKQNCTFVMLLWSYSPKTNVVLSGNLLCVSCFSCVFSGLLENGDNTKHEPQCCDVRWELKFNECSDSTFKRTHPSRQHTSATTSGAPRLNQGRLKLCLLVLVLLHTVATMTAVQNSTCLATIFPLEDNAPREEWLDVCVGGWGLALANQHAPKSERWPARNWAKLKTESNQARQAGRQIPSCALHVQCSLCPK